MTRKQIAQLLAVIAVFIMGFAVAWEIDQLYFYEFHKHAPVECLPQIRTFVLNALV